MLRVNINSQLFMSHYFIPKFLSRQKRSAIIDISSGVALSGAAMVVPYGATKAYNRIFSQVMRLEIKEKVDVLTVVTASVKSNMNPGRWVFTVTSEQHAKAVID